MLNSIVEDLTWYYSDVFRICFYKYRKSKQQELRPARPFCSSDVPSQLRLLVRDGYLRSGALRRGTYIIFALDTKLPTLASTRAAKGLTSREKIITPSSKNQHRDLELESAG